jgi:hypothetical protein
MTTIINTPGNSGGDSGSGYGFLLGVILVIVVGILFFRYGLPAIRQSGDRGDSTNINVQLPDVKVPDTKPDTGGTTGTETTP